MGSFSDDNGNADFGDVPPGEYTIKADGSSIGFDPTVASQTKQAPSGVNTPYVLVLKPVLACKWIDTLAFCGDNVRLEVTVTPAPPDGPVTVEILHPATGATVETLTNKTLTSGKLSTFWGLKSQTAAWRTDKISFRATVPNASVSGTSSNQVAFKNRPITTWALRNVNRGKPAHFADVCEKVNAQLEADRVHYEVKLRLTSGTFTAAQQSDAKSRIETIWNNGFSGKKFHRKFCGRGRTCDCAFDCCKVGYRLDCNWVASGEDHTVKVHPAATNTHSATLCSDTDWADPPIDTTTSYAHEVGHMLGQFDEYTGGGNDPSGVQPTNPPDDNLMKTAGDTHLFNRHYRWVTEFLNANTGGDPYDIIPP